MYKIRRWFQKSLNTILKTSLLLKIIACNRSHSVTERFTPNSILLPSLMAASCCTDCNRIPSPGHGRFSPPTASLQYCCVKPDIFWSKLRNININCKQISWIQSTSSCYIKMCFYSTSTQLFRKISRVHPPCKPLHSHRINLQNQVI